MTINYAILGMLSCKPLTGYDLKKIIQGASFMPWSGNNNQIYKALLELADLGFVTGETCHRDGAPSKKIYKITEAGLKELKQCSQSQAEVFEIKKSFLIQLAWTGQLSNEELKELLLNYERDIKGQIRLEQAKAETGFFNRGRTPRETTVWNLINENIVLSYETELAWIQQAQAALFGSPAKEDKHPLDFTARQAKEDTPMKYQIIEKNHQKYLWLDPGGTPVTTEQDANWLFTVCVENGVNLLLIDGERLSDEFLRLRTGIAGIALQKFVQYQIKAAAVLDDTRTQGKFKEFLTESNRGNVFRSFKTIDEAEEWLLSDHK